MIKERACQQIRGGAKVRMKSPTISLGVAASVLIQICRNSICYSPTPYLFLFWHQASVLSHATLPFSPQGKLVCQKEKFSPYLFPASNNLKYMVSPPHCEMGQARKDGVFQHVWIISIHRKGMEVSQIVTGGFMYYKAECSCPTW